MPRKQRFKPSRKPPIVTSPQVDDRQEIHPEDVHSGTTGPTRDPGARTDDLPDDRSR
jgi:hypothetical protein